MRSLTEFTPARVELERVGASVATKPLLAFRLAQARARDAVHVPLDCYGLSQDFARRSWETRLLHTVARSRQEFLLHPETGRSLNAQSVAELADVAQGSSVVFIVADGLSSLAAQRHAAPLLDLLFKSFSPFPRSDKPILIVEQARVAIGDHVGAILNADLSVVFIGERPGLSAPDSLGIYVTWQPRPGRTDAERNCISNIHESGLSYGEAVNKLAYLVHEAQTRKLTGVGLKERAGVLETHALGLTKANLML